MDSEVGLLGRRKLSEEEQVQIFVTQMLMSRLFHGDFQERRYVELINDYRCCLIFLKYSYYILWFVMHFMKLWFIEVS